ncbi:hypothetical protein DV736_g4488, partial [Chaetothyriales sp. CBS 134916]
MAFSLSDLLNPAPASGTATPTAEDEPANAPAASAAVSASAYGSFAPELFAGTDEPVADPSLAAMAADAATALELSNVAFAQGDPTATLSAALLKDEEPVDEQTQYPMGGLEEDAAVAGQHTHDHCHDTDHSYLSPPKEKKYKKRTDLIKDGPERSTVHSSKNEGQHTDKRYLCYICNKLFTRRRSVRDHINKIHNVKTWEPQRSLEITVDPATGEPVERLEDTIARGPLPPTPEKTAKKAVVVAETIEGDEGGVPTAEARTEPDSAVVTADPSPAAKTEREDTDEQQAEWPLAPPRLAAGKKRPAPDPVRPLSAAATKKGIARPSHKSMPPSKKAKFSHGDGLGDKAMALRSPSATPASTTRTPASKLKHQTNADSVASSPSTSRGGTVEPSSPTPSASATPASSNEDGEIFCICRKGDNHTWMIACDGGCDEWYHGNCVNIRERDGDLIDKYICPRCTKVGLQTTWKRMCRRKGCRKPARVLMDPPSKYCSKECGRMFFIELIRRGDPLVETAKNDQFVIDRRKAKKPLLILSPDSATEIDSESRLATPAQSADGHSEYETDSSADEDELPNRGGPLRAGEVRAILDACTSVDQWRSLGRKPDTPPREPGDHIDVDTAAADAIIQHIEYDDFEKAKLEQMAHQRKTLQEKLEVLEAREKWMDLIRTRSASIVETVKKEDKRAKDPCGFDPRFAWSEEAFLKWYGERGGKAKLATEKVEVGPSEEDEALLAEIRFEQDIVRRGLRRCDSVERGVRERGIIRAWEKTR